MWRQKGTDWRQLDLKLCRHMASSVRSHEGLIVWQRAIQLVLECYRLSNGFPSDERFGLTQQLRRAAVSIAANIAEGCGRRTRKEIVFFISVSRGSLREVETLLHIAEQLGYLSSRELELARKLAVEVGKMLNGLRKSMVRSGA
jgi:four helix bundle protein